MRAWVGMLAAALLVPREARAEDEDLPPTATSSAPQTAAQAPPWKPFNLYSLISRESVEAELQRRHLGGGTQAELLERVTRGLVAAPYLLSPLGEGEGKDPDPRFRMDTFDCTTFVETAMAMALCDELPDVERTLDRIRYHGDVRRFTARRHLITSQWIPGLVAEGYLVDITAEVAGARAKTASLELTRARWDKRKVAKELDLGEDGPPIGVFTLDYVPVAELAEIADEIPAGTLFNLVRADVPGTPDLVTHQGFVLAGPDGRRFIRHASPVSKRVIDEPIAKIVTRYQKPRAWTILGLNLLRVAVPPSKGAVATSD